MSSNLNDGSRGLSHQAPSQYFQDNAFANFDPALSSNNNHDGPTSIGQQPWSYGQPEHLGLAQPQNNPLNSNASHDAAAVYQHQHPGWHNATSSNLFHTNSQGEFHPGLFGNSFPSASGHPSSFHVATYNNNALDYKSEVADARQFERSFARPNVSQEAQYNVQSVPYSGYQYARDPAVDRGTIAPQDLQQKRQPQSGDSRGGVDNQPDARSRGAVPEQHMHLPLPPGIVSGNFLITSEEVLEGVSDSRPLHKFVHVGNAAQDVTVSKSTVPAYIPRKSRNEIMKLLASDSNLKAKLNKKLGKKAAGGVSKIKSARAPAPSLNKAVSEVKRRTSETPSDEESGDHSDSASSSSEEESIKPPLPATRPSKAIEAVRYDTVKALWRVPYRSALGDDIRKGLADFWEVTKTIRDRWKSDVLAVKQAEEAKKENELPLLKERVANQRDMLEAALRAAIAEGHKDIIEHLGENLPLMNALAVSLQDRARDGDYNGELSTAILEILSLCKTITDGNLDRTGLAKILPRFSKRGDESVKIFAKKITDNATAASKKRKEANKASLATASQSKLFKAGSTPAGAPGLPGSPVSGVKRPREGEPRTSQPTKKVASGSASGPTNPSESPASPAKKASILDSKAPVPTSTTPTAAKKVVTKPTNFFSSLQPAYKKPVAAVASSIPNQIKPPVTSTVEKKTPPASAVAATAGSTPQSKPAFSFAETMANLTRPKEVEPAPKREDSAVHETPEEKSKRLRKEQRRSLRVSFKPESELVEIRLFVHDPEEEEGHDASQVRDVGDLESEGRMFKLQHQEDQERMELDDDEDESENETEELEARKYVTPSLIDFSDIPEVDRKGNYMPYGGGAVEPDSPESQAQQKREADTLLVVYAHRSDIPPNPKEATEPVQEATLPKEFGLPPESVTSRLNDIREGSKPSPHGSLPISSTDLSALIGSLTQQSLQPPPPQQSNSQLNDLEKIVAQISNQNLHQHQPQAFSSQHYPSAQNSYGASTPQPQNPYQQGATSQQNVGAVDVSALLASLQGHLPSSTPQISNILGSLPLYGQQQQSQGYTQPPQQQQQQNQPQQQQQYPYENEERRRWREGGGTDSDQQRPWQNKKPPRDQNRPVSNAFTLPCKYWKEGKCLKGASCTYRHDND